MSTSDESSEECCVANFKSWTDRSKKSDARHFLSFDDYSTLNFLALTYHSAFGYHLEEHYFSKGNELCVSELFPDFISEEDDGAYYINLDKAVDLAEDYCLRHKTITVRLDLPGKSGWRSKPGKHTQSTFYKKQKKSVYWYEFPSQSFTSKGDNKTRKLIGPLSGRSYIKVIDLFEEVELRSEEKGDPITIDDVLFACRGICADDTRSVEKFSVLSDDGSKLVLMAHIDNWST